MAYCLQCGQPTVEKIPVGDSRLRQVCDACGFIYYENPKVICGALLVHQDQVLLCRRAIEPRYGYWTLPAGFMELKETLQQGAARETWEEAEAHVENDHLDLYCLYNVPRIGQVYALFKGRLANGEFGVGEESLECALFAEEDIPWRNLAFPSVKQTLIHYFSDRKNGQFPLHFESIDESIRQSLIDEKNENG